jgi:hypothetical protein
MLYPGNPETHFLVLPGCALSAYTDDLLPPWWSCAAFTPPYRLARFVHGGSKTRPTERRSI